MSNPSERNARAFFEWFGERLHEQGLYYRARHETASYATGVDSRPFERRLAYYIQRYPSLFGTIIPLKTALDKPIGRLVSMPTWALPELRDWMHPHDHIPLPATHQLHGQYHPPHQGLELVADDLAFEQTLGTIGEAYKQHYKESAKVRAYPGLLPRLRNPRLFRHQDEADPTIRYLLSLENILTEEGLHQDDMDATALAIPVSPSGVAHVIIDDTVMRYGELHRVRTRRVAVIASEHSVASPVKGSPFYGVFYFTGFKYHLLDCRYGPVMERVSAAVDEKFGGKTGRY